MTALTLGLLALIAFLAAGMWFSRQKTENAARMVRVLLGGGAVLAGVILSLRGAMALGIPIGLFGLGTLGQLTRNRARGERTGTGQAGQRPPSGDGGMSLSEAREILGVGEDADETAVMQAHRTLMKKVHPDTGTGSAALARQVQAARDRLLEHIRSRSGSN